MTIPAPQAPVSHEWGARRGHSRQRSRRAALRGGDPDPVEQAASSTGLPCTAVRRLGWRGAERDGGFKPPVSRRARPADARAAAAAAARGSAQGEDKDSPTLRSRAAVRRLGCRGADKDSLSSLAVLPRGGGASGGRGGRGAPSPPSCRPSMRRLNAQPDGRGWSCESIPWAAPNPERRRSFMACAPRPVSSTCWRRRRRRHAPVPSRHAAAQGPEL